eukprot:12061495-Heterocapsa_arctica.AAC.1
MDADCSNSCIWRAGRRNDPALQDKENSATALTAASMERKRLNSKCGQHIQMRGCRQARFLYRRSAD